MARWIVTQSDDQFSADSLAELKRMARDLKLRPGALIQPPGASDWIYALEIPELNAQFPVGHDYDLDDYVEKPTHTPMIIMVMLVVLAVSGATFYHFAKKVPEAQNLELGLELTEMLVTADAPIYASAEKGSTLVTVPKDSSVQMLAKRKDMYQVEYQGQKGWMSVDDVIPAYFFESAEVKKDYDPIYNPDRYVTVNNASWLQLPDQKAENTTVFQLGLTNKSKFDATNLVLLATIKDKRGRVLETKEVAIEGIVPKFQNTMVGTLGPPDNDPNAPIRLLTTASFDDLLKEDQELMLRWSDGIEVKLKNSGFVEANIELLQVQTVAHKL